MVAVAFVLVVLTNLPLAITVKYQTWVIEDFTHGYLTTYFVFFGVVILLALLIEGAVSWLSSSSRLTAQALGGVFAAAAFIVCYGTDVINAHVALTERRMYASGRRWTRGLRVRRFGDSRRQPDPGADVVRPLPGHDAPVRRLLDRVRASSREEAGRGAPFSKRVERARTVA